MSNHETSTCGVACLLCREWTVDSSSLLVQRPARNRAVKAPAPPQELAKELKGVGPVLALAVAPSVFAGRQCPVIQGLRCKTRLEVYRAWAATCLACTEQSLCIFVEQHGNVKAGPWSCVHLTLRDSGQSCARHDAGITCQLGGPEYAQVWRSLCSPVL